ncbi:MAG TPA: tetratricopeptide repeat protein [Longimicrobiaceae bacterium]|nr:tetratricopeptide repeat protein [Longimicrobiaceae bacterium]
MANVARLKEKARSLEQKSQWKAALDVYERLMAESDTEEIGLWNRIGDLHMRVGEAHRAVEAYERGVDAYADAGLLNNAIALCNKILRASPERTSVYRKLAHFTAGQGFLADARSYFLRYAERMRKLGHTDEALTAIGEAVGHLPENVELRRQYSEQLHALGRDEEAIEQLHTVISQLDARGEEAQVAEVREQIRAINPRALQDLPVPAPAPPERQPEPEPEEPLDWSADDLGLERTHAFDQPEVSGIGSLEGLERTGTDDPWFEEDGEEGPPLPLLDLEGGAAERGRELPEDEVDGGRESLPLLGTDAEWERASEAPTGGASLWEEVAGADRAPEGDYGGSTDRTAPLDTPPSGSSYERGIAFKGMGLLDEAIAELQAALREGARPVATLEALGECFFAKEQFSLAARVLERAPRVPGAEEEELIGVYYWLARCEEELGHTDGARDHLERVLSHDIRFRDARARLEALRGPGGSHGR